MREFNAVLMPCNFLRRWNYNELIPSLLYFDKVTFLMEDIEPDYIFDEYRLPGEPRRQLRSPKELEGMDDQEFIDGLRVDQHKYYWPMRNLMKEGVIETSMASLGPPIGDPPRQQLQDLLNKKDKKAIEYEQYSSLYYDEYMVNEKHDDKLTGFGKAIEVYSWIYHNLLWQRQGWQRVALTPLGYRTLLLALKVFPELHEKFLLSEVDKFGRFSQPPAQSYFVMQVIEGLLKEPLNSFTLKGDSEALSGILEIRQKYESELQTFRAAMADAANDWHLLDTDLKNVGTKVDDYINKIRPEFENARKAISPIRRITQLVLSKGGAAITIGACAGVGSTIGSMVAGPVGTVVGSMAGVVSSSVIQSIFETVGKEIMSKIEPKGIIFNKSILYLVHAEKALSV